MHYGNAYIPQERLFSQCFKVLLAEEKTDFSQEGPFACSFQAEDPQIALTDFHHQPEPDSFTLTSRFAILAAEHKTQARCREGVKPAQQLPSKHDSRRHMCTGNDLPVTAAVKRTFSCCGATYPEESLLMGGQ